MRALLIILALAISSTAIADPTKGNPDCVACHSNTDGGTVSVDLLGVPKTIQVAPGDTATVDFLFVNPIPDRNKAIVALFGTDALVGTILGLDVGVDPSNLWTTSTDGYIWSDPSGTGDYLPDTFSSYSLTFDLSLAATPGSSYPIDVIFAGGKQDWSSTDSFVVQVIPIPAAVWLLGSGLLGLVGVARMRRNKT